jgi:hypothetical protein
MYGAIPPFPHMSSWQGALGENEKEKNRHGFFLSSYHIPWSNGITFNITPLPVCLHP